MIRVALDGNPNVGKTALFNALTGARQYVANWPGVTVEKKEGIAKYNGERIRIVDLPGVYSLSASSIDEKIARDFILKEAPDVIVVITDSMSLEQGLYLLLEILEMEENVILVVNAIDEARKNGLKINKYELSKHFGVPVVFTSAIYGEGIENLLRTIVRMVKKQEKPNKVMLNYGEDIESKIKRIEKILEKVKIIGNYDTRWLALKYLEGDSEILELLKKIANIEKPSNEEIAENKVKIAKVRYDYIESVMKEAVSKIETKMVLSEAIDHVLTHKFLGIPIFFAFMYLAFKLTFDIAQVFSDMLDAAFSKISGFVVQILGENWFSSLISDGIIGGVGGVLVFVPNIFMMFLALGFMEESGYLPRAAFVMDKLMVRFKLSGRSFISLLLGFGCNVPAIMSTRSIENPYERLATILISPFISCSARLPVYILLASIFFPRNSTLVIFSLYILSVLLTIGSAIVVNRLFFRGRKFPLVMELPRYRMPTFKNLAIYVWNKGKHFLKKAGGIILAASILIWFLGYFPANGDVEKSYAAVIGKTLEPIMKPLNFSWKAATALLFGVAAKEIVVSTFSMLYGFGEEDLESAKLALSQEMNPAIAFAFLVFVMAYIPCLATVAVIKMETNSWKWPIFALVYSILVAYLLSFIAYNVGRLVL